MEAHMRKSYLAVLVLTAALAGALLVPPATSAQNTGWPFYGGDPGNTHWSALSQISTSNVHKLKAAWALQPGKPRSQHSTHLAGRPALYAASVLGPDHGFSVDYPTGEPPWP